MVAWECTSIHLGCTDNPPQPGCHRWSCKKVSRVCWRYQEIKRAGQGCRSQFLLLCAMRTRTNTTSGSDTCSPTPFRSIDIPQKRSRLEVGGLLALQSFQVGTFFCCQRLFRLSCWKQSSSFNRIYLEEASNEFYVIYALIVHFIM